jgi:hypothetical protein
MMPNQRRYSAAELFTTTWLGAFIPQSQDYNRILDEGHEGREGNGL